MGLVVPLSVDGPVVVVVEPNPNFGFSSSLFPSGGAGVSSFLALNPPIDNPGLFSPSFSGSLPLSVLVLGAPNPPNAGFFSPSLSPVDAAASPDPPNAGFFSVSLVSGAGVVAGLMPENPAKSFLTGAGVVLVESPLTEVAAVEVPGVPPKDKAGVPSLALPKPPRRLGLDLVVVSFAAPNPPKAGAVAVVSGGLGVVETLAGALAKTNGFASAGLSDVAAVVPKPPKGGFESAVVEDCPNPPKAGFVSVAAVVLLTVCCGAEVPKPPKADLDSVVIFVVVGWVAGGGAPKPPKAGLESVGVAWAGVVEVVAPNPPNAGFVSAALSVVILAVLGVAANPPNADLESVDVVEAVAEGVCAAWPKPPNAELC
jgi:hypothetical protein